MVLFCHWPLIWMAKKRGQSLADARNATTRQVAKMVFEKLYREWNR